MKIISPAFKDGDMMPKQYTCDGIDINPPLEFMDVPIQSQSLLLTVIDQEAVGGEWVHWLIWNIAPTIKKIDEGSAPIESVLGLNSFKRVEWGGPCPPSGKHDYVFTLYALDSMLDLPIDTTIFKIMQIIKDHIVDRAAITAHYER